MIDILISEDMKNMSLRIFQYLTLYYIINSIIEKNNKVKQYVFKTDKVWSSHVHSMIWIFHSKLFRCYLGIE
jgi:hypothetical protein